MTRLTATLIAALALTSSATAAPRPDNPDGTPGRPTTSYTYTTPSRDGHHRYHCHVPIHGKRHCTRLHHGAHHA